LDPYSANAGGTAVALVNTLDLRSGADSMTTTQECERVLLEGGWLVDTLTAQDAARLREMRPRLRFAFDNQDISKVVSHLNQILRENSALPQLSDHDGHWHFHYSDAGTGLASRVLNTCTMALLMIIRDDGLARFKTCAADDCINVLLDTSKNRSRRFCDARTCRNRTNVTAYRSRQKALRQVADSDNGPGSPESLRRIG
jgi:predicted RNA-binding Zn ribbon-like protein